MNMILARNMRDNLVLLTLKEGKLVDQNKKWFEGLFQSIVPCSEKEMLGKKILWVRINGLPLSLYGTRIALVKWLHR